jgi:hypothetical protein
MANDRVYMLNLRVSYKGWRLYNEDRVLKQKSECLKARRRAELDRAPPQRHSRSGTPIYFTNIV